MGKHLTKFTKAIEKKTPAAAINEKVSERSVVKVIRKTDKHALASSLPPLARQNLEALYSEVQMSIVKGFRSGMLSEKMRSSDVYSQPKYFQYLINPLSDAPLERGKFKGKGGGKISEDELRDIISEFVKSCHFTNILNHIFLHVLPKMKDNGRWIYKNDWGQVAEYFLLPDGQQEASARHRSTPGLGTNSQKTSADSFDNFQ